MIITKIKVYCFHRQFHKILEAQYFGLRELRQKKNELTQAELGQVKAEKDGVFAALECNKRELHRKKQQLNQLKVELSGEKKLRAAAEQKAESLDNQLNRAQENLNLYETELVEVKTESYGRAAALESCKEKLRKTESQLDDLKEELHQLRDCKMSWESIVRNTLHDKGVSISAAIHLINCRKHPLAGCIQVDKHALRRLRREIEPIQTRIDPFYTRPCHILFDDETRVRNKITQLAL